METEKDYVRREERFCVADLEGLQVVVRRLESEESKEFFADLLDFSRTGVKLEMPFWLQFEEQLLIRFEFNNSDLSYEGTACVRHMRSVGNQTWHVGCSIGPPIPHEIIDYLAAASGKERRRHSRKSVVKIEGVVLRQGNLDESTAAMQNYSEGGFCIRVPGPYDSGERVRLRLQNINGSPETISARVRWQNETDEGFEIGCSFADSEGFERLLSCIPDTSLLEGSKREKPSKWPVIAATVLALFIPPLVSLWIQSGSSPFWNARAESAPSSITGNLFQDSITSQNRPPQLVTENSLAGGTGPIADEPLEHHPHEFNKNAFDTALIPADPPQEIVGGLDRAAGIDPAKDPMSIEQNANDRSSEKNGHTVDSSPEVKLSNKIFIRFEGPAFPQRLLQSTPFAPPTRMSTTSSSRRLVDVP